MVMRDTEGTTWEGDRQGGEMEMENGGGAREVVVIRKCDRDNDGDND